MEGPSYLTKYPEPSIIVCLWSLTPLSRGFIKGKGEVKGGIRMKRVLALQRTAQLNRFRIGPIIISCTSSNKQCCNSNPDPK